MMEFKAQAFTVSDLYNWYRSGELFLQPKFQRRRVWKPVARSYLIDTVVRGLPMPKIYFRMQVDPVTVKSVREIVDGQQRLDAIFNYIDDDFVVYKSHTSVVAGKKFSDLPNHIKSQILSYDIAADLLIGVSDAQVLQIFARINSYSVTLNDQEKRNAKYFGRFKEFVYNLGTEHLVFWTKRKILTDQNIARMAEAELVSELIIGMMAGLQDKKSSLDKYYTTYEDVFPQARLLRIQFEGVINWIEINIGDQLTKTAFRRKTLFYSLFMAVTDILYGIPDGVGPISPTIPISLSKNKRKRLHEKLNEVSFAIKLDSPPKDISEFAAAAARQTDNIKPRKTRHKYLVDIIMSI